MDGAPDMFWYPWLDSQLQQHGYSVWLPTLPNAPEPRLEEWLAVALRDGTYNEESVVVGHSAGCPLILSILENIEVRVKQAVLVAAFFEPLGESGPEPILQNSYDWEKIRAHVDDLIIINSDNDPWGCDVEAALKLQKNVGATVIIPHGQAHMGSTSFDQPYREFPLLTKLIL